MGGYHSGAVDHGIAHGLRFIAQVGFYPQCFQAKGGVFGGGPVQGAENLAGVNGHLFAGVNLRLAQGNTVEGNTIGTGRQVEVVTNMHGLYQKPQIL